MANRYSNRHREEDPERKEAVEEGELLALQRSAYLALSIRLSGHRHLPSSRVENSIRSRRGCSQKSGEFCRTAAGSGQTRPVRLHRPLFREPGQGLAQYLSSAQTRRHDDAVVHPPAIAPRLDDSSPAKVGQVPGYFGLALLQNFDKIADANLLISHHVHQAETRIVPEGLKEPLHVER